MFPPRAMQQNTIHQQITNSLINNPKHPGLFWYHRRVSFGCVNRTIKILISQQLELVALVARDADRQYLVQSTVSWLGKLTLDSFTNMLANSFGNRWFHHCEMITLDGDHLAFLDIKESVPAVGTEVGSVLQKPFH